MVFVALHSHPDPPPLAFWFFCGCLPGVCSQIPCFRYIGIPADITEATNFAPNQDLGMSTEGPIALRARQLTKHPDDIEKTHNIITCSPIRNLNQFEKSRHGKITDFDFKPGALILLWNPRAEDALDRKSKPRYVRPLLIVRKIEGRSCVVAELDGTEPQLCIMGFQLIP